MHHGPDGLYSFFTYYVVMGEEWRGRSGGGGARDAFCDLHFGIMSTFVNVKIVCFAVIVNKDRK